MLDVLNTEFDDHLAMIVTRTICSITLQEDALLLEDFRRHETITLIISKIYKYLISIYLILNKKSFNFLQTSLMKYYIKYYFIEVYCKNQNNLYKYTYIYFLFRFQN